MKCGNYGATVAAEDLAAHARDAFPLTGSGELAHGMAPERNNNFRIDDLDLFQQIGSAGGGLVGRGIAVFRRSALDHVGDEDVGATELHAGFDDAREELARGADEGAPLRILGGTGALADEHHAGCRGAFAGNGVAACFAQSAEPASADGVCERGQILGLLLGGSDNGSVLGNEGGAPRRGIGGGTRHGCWSRARRRTGGHVSRGADGRRNRRRRNAGRRRRELGGGAESADRAFLAKELEMPAGARDQLPQLLLRIDGRVAGHGGHPIRCQRRGLGKRHIAVVLFAPLRWLPTDVLHDLAEWLGTSHSARSTVWLLAAVAAYGAARALDRSRLAAAGAALFMALHPAFSGADPFGAASILVSSAAGLALVACVRLPWIAQIPAMGICGLLTASGESAAPFGLAAVAFAAHPDPGTQREPALRQRVRWAMIGLAAGLFAWRFLSLAGWGTQIAAALLGAGGSLVPVQPHPDAIAMADPVDTIRTPMPALNRVLQLAALAGLLAPLWRPLRRCAVPFSVGIVFLAFLTPESAFLHDRAALSMVPAAALLGAGFLDALRERFGAGWTRRQMAIGFVVAAATLSGLTWKRWKHSHRSDYLEVAREKAPASAVIREACGQLLVARAQDPQTAAKDRPDLWRRALAEFDEAAKAARDSDRAFREKLLAADAADHAVSFEEAKRRLVDLLQSDRGASRRAETLLSLVKLHRRHEDAAGADQWLADPTTKQIAVGNPDLLQEILRSEGAAFAAKASAGGDPQKLLPELQRWYGEWEGSLRNSAPSTKAVLLASRGRAETALGKPIDAQRSFQAAKAADPRCADAYLGAAEAYLSAGVLQGAAKELQAGIEITAPTPPAELLVSLAAVQLQGGADPEQVVRLVEAARATDPSMPQLRRTLASALTALAEERLRKGNVAAAEAAAVRAVAESPERARPFDALGRVREEQKRHPEALAAFERAYELERNEERRDLYAGALKRQALGLVLEGKRREALDAFVKVRELASPRVELGSGTDFLEGEAQREIDAANAALERKDAAAAQQALERALRYVPEHPAALSSLGILFAEKGDDARAVDLWSHAAAGAKVRGADLRRSSLLLNLANALRRLSRYDESRKAAQEYLQLGDGPHRAQLEALLEVLDLLEKRPKPPAGK